MATNAPNQHRQRHHERLMAPEQIANRPRQQPGGRHSTPLNGKDLIIRMLAEVFQVSQTDEGQVKWQQVSSSLVPFSLYSRTTNKWLNYLLTAPTVANNTTASSGMSPDSRDFLLLLQQFHHQQNSNRTNAQQQSEQQPQDQVVFQVVAHDYLDGQCKKILNVKLVQPGTRLGQASDYFVYWKEQPTWSNNLQSSLSFNSNNSLSRPPYTNPYNEGVATNQFVSTCCGQSFETNQPPPQTTVEPQTWGLNFASINDAKLFYDICSLNLVDLDFNSEYLKQLASSGGLRNRNNLAVCQNLLPQFVCGSQQGEQKLIRDFLNYKQRQHGHSPAAQATSSKLSQQQHDSCQLIDSALKRSQSKCPSCRNVLEANEQQQQQQQSRMGSIQTGPLNYNAHCPVHARQPNDTLTARRQQSIGNSTAQVRSRSSTRQMVAPLEGTVRSHSSLKRTRSFSTPATPDHKQSNCPHQESSTDGELHHHDQKAETHHPRCVSYMKQQQQRQGTSVRLHKKQSTDTERPRKPVRGVLRDLTTGNVPSQRVNSASASSARQSSTAELSHLLDANRLVKSQYMSNQSSQTISNSKHESERHQPIQQRSQNYSSSNDPKILPSQPMKKVLHGEPKQDNQQEEERFFQSKSARRRYTGVDSTEISHLDSLSHHSASLARAQYANSKNMKEFLSLDAGGVLPAPNQLADINRRFEDELKIKIFRRQNEGSNLSSDRIKPQPHDHTKKTAVDQSSQYSEKRAANDTLDSSEIACEINVEQSFVEPVECDEDTTRHVATTTEDLPLDPLTKRRMYIMNSEEVISEHTEPKSCRSTPLELGQQQPQFPNEKGDERQIRAVSLGPTAGDGLRGLNTRSNTGRRRSLERSMCVDLDPNQTVSSTFRKAYCLSPLAQSTGQITARGLDSFESSPHCDGQSRQHLIKVHQEPLMANLSAETRENMAERHTRFSGTQKRARTRSSPSHWPMNGKYHQQMDYSSHPDPMRDCSPALYGTSSKRFREEPSRNCSSTGMMSFKSAPDVNWSGHNTSMGNDNNCDEHGFSRLAKKNLASPSSYAIPLCSEVRSSQYGRTFHSCPNSLRRIKRDLHHQCEEKQWAESLLLADNSSRQVCSTRVAPTDCSHCGCGRRSANASLPARCLIYDEASIFSGHDKSLPQQHRIQQHRQQHEYSHHHHQHRLPTCMNNAMNKQAARGRSECFTSSGPDCAHARNRNTCGSLQSCRSPLRYGLYESDCDEEPVDEDIPQELAVEQHSRDFAYPAKLSSTCCSAKNSHPSKGSLTRSASSFYFRPLNATTTIALKPVDGYDQTMARSSLKSRQRSRSQPPKEPAFDTFHLNKSMENVQKLIREVQNELNVLNRRPIESFCPQGHSSTINTQLRCGEHPSPVMPINLDYHSASRNPEPQTFNEETNAASDICRSNQLPKISGSSATRAASQFRSVGAIRKAGFLSVKKWILKRRQSIELGRKQGWKRYWICLRGTSLLFHSIVDKKDSDPTNVDGNTVNLLTWIQTNCATQPNLLKSILMEFSNCSDLDKELDQNNAITRVQLAQCYIEREPRHLIMIEGAIAQPIPEHPKRDFVFCLSTIFGDAYLFQSSCQLESENWIMSMHNACAASLARDLTRDEAIKFFETKIRRLELEAEKKLFLRQRLESRLNLMSSIGHISSMTDQSSTIPGNPNNLGHIESLEIDEQSSKRVTMRALLCRLNQQLLALDTHIERIHCEIYQLRCYLTSCGSQNLFYLDSIAQSKLAGGHSISPSLLSLDLPHPRSLLQYVSKPTKLLLIKLGVFTVSSFHAFVHARQGSAEALLQRLNPNRGSADLDPTNHAISESVYMDRVQNVKLENDTEKLIDMTNLEVVLVRLTKKLFNRISKTKLTQYMTENQSEIAILTPESDSSYSIHDEGEFILISLKLHSSSTSLTIIKRALNVIDPDLDSFDHLNYYLRLNLSSGSIPKSDDDNSHTIGATRKSSAQYEVKRKETLNDWSNYDSLELLEKIIFRIELTRSRPDEDTAPFGISIGAQLFAGRSESFLNVFCSYVEWGSVADKSGLKDDDDLLMINGVPVMDLDLMFIECIIQDESKLRLVVRSSRPECPSNATLLDKFTLNAPDGGPDDGTDESRKYRGFKRNESATRHSETNACSGSQVISDEYISSLVCPPPPTRSSAFLRTDCTLLRQKSDLSNEVGNKLHRGTKPVSNKVPLEGSYAQTITTSIETNLGQPIGKMQSKSQINLVDVGGSYEIENFEVNNGTGHVENILQGSQNDLNSSSVILETIEPLMQGGSLNKPSSDMGRNIGKEDQTSNGPDESGIVPKRSGLNSIERLRKSILELLETEYAYIKHLETISEHYMSPLEEMSYLGISNLKQMDKIIRELLIFQKGFFLKLTRELLAAADIHRDSVVDELEQLDIVMHQLDRYRDVDDFGRPLSGIAKTFAEESENFKIYAAYCAAYSTLQRILHPRNLSLAFSQCAFSNPLDTFLFSNNAQSISTDPVLNNGQQHRDFLKPFSGSFTPKTNNNGNNDPETQLKQINQFLNQLESGSSSASLSLPKSSSGSERTLSRPLNRTKFFKQGSQAIQTQQKSVHQQNFESYLIKPIQRIVKYPILLKSIAVSAQLISDAETYRELQTAVKYMESITSHVNNAQRIHDEYGLIFKQIESQYSIENQKCDQPAASTCLAGPHKPLVSLSMEHLLYFGPVEWLNINEYTSKLKKGMDLTQVLFIFNSCVVFICKEFVFRPAKSMKLPSSSTCHNLNFNNSNNTDTGSRVASKAFHKNNTDFNEVIRYQSIIPVSEVQVRSVSVYPQGTQAKELSKSSSANGGSYQWELFRCSSVNSNSNLLTKSNRKNTSGKVYLLANNSNETRNAFLRKIRFIIRESVRNMNLPVTRSPLSKSLALKKLSSPSSAGCTNTSNSTCSHSTSGSPVYNSGDNSKGMVRDVECDFARGHVDSANYTTSVEVNN